ncbi:hypothetical protein EDC04DRAFT_2613388 [Pisolithus marmoratus]|nr:hypothetical protein EDC04DRAFT_2613388 [Pisolithus marmoratus]
MSWNYICNNLMEGTKYIHGDCDEEGKFDNFSSTALQDLCVMGYYIGKSSLAASCPNVFSKNLPTGALAFATTAVAPLLLSEKSALIYCHLTAGADEYATGAFAAVKFFHEDYSKVNEQFLDIISNIKKGTEKYCHTRMICSAKNPVISTGVVSASGQHNFTAHLD